MLVFDQSNQQSVKTGESVGDVPVVDNREAQANLLMKDNKVIVMSGLRRKETRITNNKVKDRKSPENFHIGIDSNIAKYDFTSGKIYLKLNHSNIKTDSDKTIRLDGGYFFSLN